MNYSKKILNFLPVLPLLFCAFLFGGCYTKLASYQNETIAANSGGCSECGDEAPVNNRREVCVWERDIFGFPEMRCYTTNYSSSWMYFHSTPWWYRSNYRWYDSRGCPPHYYYDRGSGICRYYGASTYPSGGGGGGGSAAGKQAPPPRRNSRVVPPAEERAVEPAPVTSGSVSLPSGAPIFSGGGAGKQLSPVSSPAQSSTPPNAGLSKPQDASNQQPPQETQQQQPPQPPPQEQRPKDDTPKSPPPRRSSRGI